MASLSSIGQPTAHVEGPAKVTGQAKYSADIILPGMLWGKCLRSPFPHARVVSIDTANAKQVPGVYAVLTGADLSGCTGAGEKALSLTKAIHALKPDAKAKGEAKNAEQQAKDDLKELGV